MMAGRATFWLLFLGGAAAVAVGPQLFEEPAAEVVQVAPQKPRQGQLAELRSPGGAQGRGAASAAAESPTHGQALAAPPRSRTGPPVADLFAAHDWNPPLPPPAAPPPPPSTPPQLAAPAAPVAPALPFEYFGKLDDSTRVVVFLARGDKIFTVAEGDVVDGAYKVKTITDTQMTLVYLPLNLDQTLAVGNKL